MLMKAQPMKLIVQYAFELQVLDVPQIIVNAIIIILCIWASMVFRIQTMTFVCLIFFKNLK